MRKSWLDYFRTGSREREAFEDVDAIISQETKKDALYVNFGSADTPLEVYHSLKKMPTAFILTEAESAIIIYATSKDRASWTDKKIVLRSNTTGRYGICVL
jgi:hypothetical protein